MRDSQLSDGVVLRAVWGRARDYVVLDGLVGVAAMQVRLTGSCYVRKRPLLRGLFCHAALMARCGVWVDQALASGAIEKRDSRHALGRFCFSRMRLLQRS